MRRDLLRLPRRSATPPPFDQSISRNRDGGRSSAQTIAPSGTLGTWVTPPRRIRSTRSRTSAKSDERARRYSLGAEL